MIELDGSFGEGGGAIIRNALALSALTGKPFKVSKIRRSRSNPGLRAQHLHSVLAVKKLCNAKVKHAELHSTDLEFFPDTITPQTISVDIGTAGSITLLLQSILLPSIFSGGKVRLKIRGGTDTKWSIPFDYFTNVFLPRINHLAEFDVDLQQRGYYPKGGGKVDIKVKSKVHYLNLDSISKIKKFELLDRGNLLFVKGISHASLELDNANVAQRQAKAAKKTLNKFGCNISITYSKTLSIGSGICLWAGYDSGAIIGADALGERGKRAEIVGKEAAQNLVQELNQDAPIDRFLADQLITYLALIGGKIQTTKITNHTLTNIYVAEKFFGKKFKIEGNLIIS